MDESALENLLKKLEGLDWFIFSGLAVKIYADPDREIDDIDFMVRDSDIDEFAERLGAEVEDRDFIKEGNRVEDRGFITDFKGIEVEATFGFPEKRRVEGTIERLFENSKKESFEGFEVNVVPPEELVVHKAKMDREKDRTDLRSLSVMDLDEDLIYQLIEDWGLEEEKVISILREEGFSF